MKMSFAVVRYLNRMEPRAFRPPLHNLLRMTGTDNSPPKSQEPASAKAGESPCPPPPSPPPTPPPPPPASTCPQPPPCPSLSQSVSIPQCPPLVDPNNPCNYCPPPCFDPDYPDLTKLKKLQCMFQENDGRPIFLKRGNIDAFLYQLTLVLVLICTVFSVVSTIKAGKK